MECRERGAVTLLTGVQGREQGWGWPALRGGVCGAPPVAGRWGGAGVAVCCLRLATGVSKAWDLAATAGQVVLSRLWPEGRGQAPPRPPLRPPPPRLPDVALGAHSLLLFHFLFCAKRFPLNKQPWKPSACRSGCSRVALWLLGHRLAGWGGGRDPAAGRPAPTPSCPRGAQGGS